MKAFNAVLKILTALAAVAGAVYIIATYGEQIVAWAKEIWAKMPQCPCKCDAEPVAEVVEEPAEAAETVEAEEPVQEAAPEVVVPADEPVAEEADFAE